MTINIDAIMQELLESVNERTENALWLNVTGTTLLKDYRTVGLYLPRASGATHYLLEQLKNNERAILIVPTKGIKGTVVDNFTFFTGETLSPSMIHRIHTSDDILKAIKTVRNGQQDYLLETVELILIDSGTRFFERIRRNKFYQWLYTRGGNNQTVVIFN